MNTGKQINAMVLVVLLLAIATGAYAMWDNSRADTAKDEQLAKTSERAATTFALNCRLCHGDRGEGGLAGGRLLGAPPLDGESFRGINDGMFSEDDLAKAFQFVSNTIMCGRIGTAMPTWGQSQGGVLNREQIRQLAVLITEGRWYLAQEHADELDAEATAHASVRMPDGEPFSAGATELIVSNAAPFSVDQYIRIGPDRLEVERGVDGTEASSHGSGTEILIADTEAETDTSLEEAIDAEDTLLVVDEVGDFEAGDILQLDDEKVRVRDIFEEERLLITDVPTTGLTLAESIGRTPGEFLASGAEGIEVGTIIRMDAELLEVTAIRDDGDLDIELDEGTSASATRISVSDATFFQTDYAVRVDGERLRIIGAVETGQILGEALGRAETTFIVSGTAGLSTDLVIRMDRELLRVIEIEPATIEVERGVPDEEGNATQASAHSTGASILQTDVNEDEEPDTGQTLLEAIEPGATTFTVSGTSGILEGEIYQIGDELVRVVEDGIKPARLRVERGVNDTSRAEHPSRAAIFEGNLLDVERGVEGSNAAGHDEGASVFVTEVEVERSVGPNSREIHTKGAEIFLGHRLIVERGAFETEASDHPSGVLVMNFPTAPEPETNTGEACGLQIAAAPTQPSGPTPTPAPDAQDVAISLFEWGVTADQSSVVGGAINFQASNDGAVLHNLRVIATDLAPDDLPVSGGSVDEESEELEVVATVFDLAPGETGSSAGELVPGNYVLICNVPGHYLSGMFTGFEVTAP